MGEAAKLLAEAAGWTSEGRRARQCRGRAADRRVPAGAARLRAHRAALRQGTCEKLGIKASVRIVDSSQYKRRERHASTSTSSSTTFAQSQSPGNEQRDFWGSAAADQEGSRNVIGIKNPAIDKLIDKIVFAKDRAELVAATRALDRVLLWNHYVVPQWHYPFDRIAIWDMFGRPQKLPSQTPASLSRVWWIDDAKQPRRSPTQQEPMMCSAPMRTACRRSAVVRGRAAVAR